MFAVDDELETSPKFEALDSLPAARRARAFEAWVRLGAACRKRGNGGLITSALAEKILHKWRPSERAETLLDLVAARGGRPQGLLVSDGDAWRFHAWPEWQPDENESAEERDTVSKKTLRQRRWRHKKRVGVDADASTVDVSEETRATSTETSPEQSRARRAPATRVRVPDPVPSRPIPAEDHARPLLDQVEGEPVDTPLGRLLRGFQRRWEAKRLPSGMALGPGWPGVQQHRALADQIAELYANDHVALERSLDGYFASEQAASFRWNFKTWASDPGRWVATLSEPRFDAKETLSRIPRIGPTGRDP